MKAFESERSEGESTWKFRVELQPDDLDGGWVAECLDLPGCMSEGETQDEALRNLIDAMSDVINFRMRSHLTPLDAKDEGVRQVAVSV